MPAGTTLQGNIFSNLGIEVKQAGGLYSALSANHTLRSNIFYNLPRAAVNINDGAHGGHELVNNLFFATVRETSDHGTSLSLSRALPPPSLSQQCCANLLARSTEPVDTLACMYVLCLR